MPPLADERFIQASGVAVNSICLDTFQRLKLKKDLKYIIFSLNKDNTEIVVHKESAESDYDKFLEDLPDDEPRWAVYDFEYEAEGGGKRNKLVFFSWCVLTWIIVYTKPRGASLNIY